MEKLIILTGASGSGKTTIVNSLKTNPALCYLNLVTHSFDSIGIPPINEMIDSCGSIENWQRTQTHLWIERIQSESAKYDYVVFEGQMRIAFIKEALKKNNLQGSQIILIDCTDSVRRTRLIEHRNQPELVNDEMLQWAQFLRAEAAEATICQVDTSFLSAQEAAQAVISKSALCKKSSKKKDCCKN